VVDDEPQRGACQTLKGYSLAFLFIRTAYTANSKLIYPHGRHSGPVWQVAWAHPKFGHILASRSYDGKVIIWKEQYQPLPQRMNAFSRRVDTSYVSLATASHAHHVTAGVHQHFTVEQEPSLLPISLFSHLGDIPGHNHL